MKTVWIVTAAMRVGEMDMYVRVDGASVEVAATMDPAMNMAE